MFTTLFATGFAAAVTAGGCGGGDSYTQTAASDCSAAKTACTSAATAKGSCGSASGAAVTAASYDEKNDIVQTAVAAGQFNTLATALTEAGLVDALKGDGPFTVFAPTDAAFAKLPDGTLESLLKPANRDRLTAILTYHVVPGRVLAADVVELNNATTLNGQRVDITANDSGVRIDNAKVVRTDIKASNGVIHVIDEVILPQSDSIVDVASSNGSFGTLLAAAEAAGLADTLAEGGPFTIFAPTDAAFEKLPAGTVASLLRPENREKLVEILTYHLVEGRVYADQVVKLDAATTIGGSDVSIHAGDGGVNVNNANVVATDIEASNGVIHVIDRVLLPGN